MTTLKYGVPSVGEKNTVAEPKVDTALTELKTVVNGGLEGGGVNLKAGTVAKTDLTSALQSELASFVGLPLESKKSIIATEQERTSATYGVLTTPDEVEVTIPANGMIAVAFQATWKSSSGGAGRAAIFVGANQLKGYYGTSEPPVVQEANGPGGTSTFGLLTSSQFGLQSSGGASAGTAYTGDVTTGQILGTGGSLGGPIYIDNLAAGTYKITVQFKSAAGSVTVKGRRLKAWVIG